MIVCNGKTKLRTQRNDPTVPHGPIWAGPEKSVPMERGQPSIVCRICACYPNGLKYPERRLFVDMSPYAHISYVSRVVKRVWPLELDFLCSNPDSTAYESYNLGQMT